jgi:hypothetical protein
MDLKIRIRIKMSWIRNTSWNFVFICKVNYINTLPLCFTFVSISIICIFISYLAGGEDVLPIPGEGDRADLVPVVRLEEGGDATVRHRVPDLDAPVHRPGHEMLPVIRPSTKEKISIIVLKDFSRKKYFWVIIALSSNFKCKLFFCQYLSFSV